MNLYVPITLCGNLGVRQNNGCPIAAIYFSISFIDESCLFQGGINIDVLDTDTAVIKFAYLEIITKMV